MNSKNYFSGIVFLILLTTVFIETEAQEMSSGISRVLNQIADQFPQTEGHVVTVVDDELILDLKQGQSLQVGERMKLIRFGKKLTHPVTGKTLGYMETDLGEIEILEVRKNFTRAKAVDPNVKAFKGDGVRSRFRRITLLSAQVDSQVSGPLDTVTLTATLERKINEHPRFSSPSFDLQVWLLESGLSVEDLIQTESLERLRKEVSVDYILLTEIREIKGKWIFGYKLISAIDGLVAKRGKTLSSDLGIRSQENKVGQIIPEKKSEIRFNVSEKKGIDFVSKQKFDFEIVDYDVGDINGDGRLEYVVAAPSKLIIYSYEGGRFNRIAQVSRPKNENKFLATDVGDINGNGRDEIFVTNKHLDRLSSFVLEYRGNKMISLWKNVDFYFRIIRPISGKPQLLLQKPGIDKPFDDDIFNVKYKNGKYARGRPLKLHDSQNRRMQFMLYGMNRLDLNSDKNIETIILDKDYHLRVYSATGEMLVKSDEYYGHDPRIMDIGLTERWVEMSDMPGRVAPVYFRGRLALRERQGRRFLLVPRNHRLGGQLLERTVLVNNCSLVILELGKEGFKKIFETRKQRGYLAAYQVIGVDTEGMRINVASVVRGGLGKKTVSTVFTYSWSP